MSVGCSGEAQVTGTFSTAFEKRLTGWVQDFPQDPILRDKNSQAHYTITVTDLNLGVNIKGEQQGSFLQEIRFFLRRCFERMSHLLMGIASDVPARLT